MGASHGKECALTKENDVVAEQSKTEYRIVVENSTTTLTERVNAWLNEGWELQGGVSGHTRITAHPRSNHISYDELWAQTMIKKQ
jgi:hypothetical protein